MIQPTPWLSFYGSYSQSFGAISNAFAAPGRPLFPPEKGIQYEGGAKAEFFDKRLTATVDIFRGLGLGGGVIAVGERQGDNDNTVQLPQYARADAMVMYRLKPDGLPFIQNQTAQLKVKNLFNTTYYETARDIYGIRPGAPRTFIASLRAEL